MKQLFWRCMFLYLLQFREGHTLTKRDDDFCDQRESGTYLYPRKCHFFAMCNNGKLANLNSCGDGFFNAEYNQCREKEEFVCQNVADSGECRTIPVPVLTTCPTRVISYDAVCQKQRGEEKQKARAWYKLTLQGGTKTILYPFTFIPWLNQSITKVGFHTAIDPFESRWASLFSTVRSTIGRAKLGIIDQMVGKDFFKYDDYKEVYEKFNQGVKALQAPQYYSNPAFETTKAFIDNDEWMSDEFFVMKRLAGACPFLLQRVTIDGSVGMSVIELRRQLNPNFNFDDVLKKAINEDITLDQAVSRNLLYVLYHKEHDGLESLEDLLDRDPNDSRTMMNTTSPIALFIRDNNGNLKVAAIQIDYLPSSSVYTPDSDAVQWLTAKAMVESADGDICQAMHHLSHVHFSSTIYCTIFRRHFSTLHPIYEIMKYHCEGATPHISLSFPVLSFPDLAGHRLLSVGHTGFVKLATDAYHQHKYGLLDYDNLLRSRGLDDDTLAYYPFRDDGKIIWNEINKFARDFVDLYYVPADKTESDKQYVADDNELQSFANEMSARGTLLPDGGNGKMIDFPSKFTTTAEVHRFIRSFIWIVAFHAVVNYPAEPFNTFAPMAPTKLYKDTDPAAAHNFARVLPDALTTIGIAEFATFLGNTRINRLMDHYGKVKDPNLEWIIRKSYSRLNGCIQKELSERNKERLKNGQLPYEYLEPKWIPNSVHI